MKKKKYSYMNRRNFKIFLTAVIVLLILAAVVLTYSYSNRNYDIEAESKEYEKIEKAQKKAEKETRQAIRAREKAKSTTYSFLQGPKSYEGGYDWAGEWCNININGNKFGAFGCGLCCIANIYSTISPYECSPKDAFKYAKKASNYSPTSVAGAIDWKDMKKTLKKMGFTCSIETKPATLEEFEKKVSGAQCAIALVSSNNDDTYWEDTPGHYVTIWLYDETEEQVFLTDSGSPARNRNDIPCEYVYDALKTSGDYQVLYVWSYNEDENKWKSDGIDEVWNVPSVEQQVQ